MLTVSAYSTIGIPLIPRTMPPAAVKTTCATVLCADLHGYDTLAEQLPPSQVASMLGAYFAILTDTVLEYGGMVFHLAEADMMAGFGVGDTRHTQIHEALTAARTIQQRFAPVRSSWRKEHQVNAGVGVGIHRGEVAVGTFGPSEHTALTLVGDAAHVAAQLCKRARAGEVLLSAAVHLPHRCSWHAIGAAEPMTLVHLPPLQLRGRSAPIDVWCAPAARRPRMGTRH
ncbi:MAG TPA: adenylate/guanylate cyclase domain-containing protein [Steroidobacteraceae bacterium]|nr:adenylate/guanylate cyclase domain-containing protein [Steroidobacteraceae bacterium]